MTGLELLNRFNIESKVYQLTKNSLFYTNEIEYILNKAQDNVFQKYYDEFEKTESIRAGLDKLITVVELTVSDKSADQSGIKLNGTIYDMPEDFGYSTEESVKDSNDRYITVKPISRDYYNVNIINPYKKPDKDLIWRLDRKPTAIGGVRRKELVTDGDIIMTNYNITYIIRPSTINVANNEIQLQLGLKAIKELINEAIIIAYGINRNKIYQQPNEGIDINK